MTTNWSSASSTGCRGWTSPRLASRRGVHHRDRGTEKTRIEKKKRTTAHHDEAALTDRERLLLAIAEAPDDDAPRLVYADWLEEHGDEARAEFVRAQVAVAAQGGVWRCSPAVSDRAEELWKEHEREWTSELPPWARFLPHFEHGVLHRVHMTASNFLRHGRNLFALFPTVRVVDFRGDGGVWPQLAACPALANVHEVATNWGRYTATDAAALVGSPHLRGLEALTISQRPAPADGPQSFDWFGLLGPDGLPALADLALRHNPFDEEGAHLLGQVPLPLRSLSVDGAGLGARGIVYLGPLLRRGGLRALDLRSNALGDEALAILADCRPSDLVSLRLDRNEIGAEGVAALASAPWPRLEELDLWDNPLGGQAVDALLGPNLPALARLNLSDTGVDDEAVLRLARHPGAARLRELTLSYANLGNEAIQSLANSPYLANLEVLDVGSNRFDDEAAFALAASRRLGKLRTVCVAHHRLTDAGLAALGGRFGVWGAKLR